MFMMMKMVALFFVQRGMGLKWKKIKSKGEEGGEWEARGFDQFSSLCRFRSAATSYDFFMFISMLFFFSCCRRAFVACCCDTRGGKASPCPGSEIILGVFMGGGGVTSVDVVQNDVVDKS